MPVVAGGCVRLTATVLRKQPGQTRFRPALCLRRHAHRRIDGAVLAIVANTLYDLEKETIIERVGISVQEFAFVVLVVEQIGMLKLCQARVVQSPFGAEILIIVGWDWQGLRTACCQLTQRTEDVRGGERDMMHAGTGERSDKPPGRSLPAFGNVQWQPDAAFRADQGPATHQPVGIGNFPKRLWDKSKYRPIEQDEFVHATGR